MMSDSRAVLDGAALIGTRLPDAVPVLPRDPEIVADFLEAEVLERT